MKPSRDVIFTTLYRIRFEAVAPFIFSLRHTGYNGEVVAFATMMDEEVVAKLRHHGVTVVPFTHHWRIVKRIVRLWPLWWRVFASNASQATKEKLAHLVFHLFYRRHLLYLQFLRQNQSKYDRVFLTDSRDVYFQANPFSWNPESGLHFFLEEASNKIGESSDHVRWLKSQFGQKVLDELARETISCAGTTMGDTVSIMEYLSRMVALSMNAFSLREHDGDQGIHNYIFYEKILPEIIIHENRRGPVMTLGAMKPQNVRLNAQGWVINDDGQIPAVLHQYDRHPEAAKILQGHLHNSAP
jgi:hypothetical protein